MVNGSKGGWTSDATKSLLVGDSFESEKISSVTEVPIGAIVGDLSPRVSGENTAHTRLLAELGEVLPPILVHKPSMHVIDGVHRLKAVISRGEETVRVQYFDGTNEDAFLLSVQLNTGHGLPLSLGDRRAAARRILMFHPEWSDRRIGQIAGLDHKTVGAIRRNSDGELPQLTSREGRDGRVRRSKPQVPGRNAETDGQPKVNLPAVIPRLTSINGDATESADTAIDRPRPGGEAGLLHGGCDRRVGFDREFSLKRLRADPSLRFNDSGRALIRWLEASPRTAEESIAIADRAPSHCLDLLMSIANQNLENWSRISDRLSQRKRSHQQAELGE
ncbi:ParB/RepB/Spo0J family partition protein [Nocardia sp. NPDC051570]|uniref:ParB/RepB/Spo0J family partition protein n=1 Tax=Nocardia sp. NPDC051570 TaxID=3364324 RepID=UPI0037AAE39F